MPSGKTEKLLLVGWDAADWGMIEPLLAAGRLPNLKRLMERGVAGPLTAFESFDPAVSWTTLLTGARAFRHQVLSGYELERRQVGQVRQTESSARQRKALWSVLSQAGKRSVSVAFPVSSPAEEVLGVLVSREFTRAGDAAPPLQGGVGEWEGGGRLVFPEGLASELAAVLVRPGQLGSGAYLAFVPDARRIDQSKDTRLLPLGSSLAETATVHAMFTACMQHEPWEVAAVHYSGIAQLQRAFMEYCPPRLARIPESDARLYGGVVGQAYEFHDMMLGRLLELAGPDANVMVVSAHGYMTGSGRPPQSPKSLEDLEEWHRRTGVLVMAGPGVRHEEFLDGATVLDVLPTVLALLGLGAGRDMEGRVLVEAIVRPEAPVRVDSWESRPSSSTQVEGAAAHVQLGGNTPDPGHEPATDPTIAATEKAIAHLLELGYARPAPERWRKAIQWVRDGHRYNLARSLLEANLPDRAAPILEDLVKSHPDRLIYARCLFDAYAAAGRTASMEELVQGLWDKGYRGPLVRLGMGVVALGRRQPAVALQHFDAVMRPGTPSPLLDVYAGRAFLRLREWQRAKEAFERVVTSDDRNEHGWAGLARACLGLGEVESAVEHALRAVSVRPDLGDAHYHLGLALLRLEQPDRASIALKRCISVAPQFLPPYRKLAELYGGPLNDPARAKAITAEANRLMLVQRLRRQGLEALRARAEKTGTS